MDAHDLFLRGRELLLANKRDRETFERSTAYFRRAIELDPNYAGPYAGLGMAYMLDYQNHWSDTPEKSLDEAVRLIDESIARDDKDPFAHYVASVVYMWKRDYERSANEADTALSLNPNYALALNVRGIVHIYTGEPAKAIPDIEHAIRLDPAQQLYRHFLGTAYFVAGNYETAAAVFKDRIAMTPTTDLSRAFLASALGHLGPPRRPARSGASLRRSIRDTLTRIILVDCRLEIPRTPTIHRRPAQGRPSGVTRRALLACRLLALRVVRGSATSCLKLREERTSRGHGIWVAIDPNWTSKRGVFG